MSRQLLPIVIAAGGLMSLCACVSPPPPPAAPVGVRFPTVPADHVHVQALLANAFKYVAPGNGIFDPATGFPVEGWNHDPAQDFSLRTFTQLTAIGAWVELLATVVAGQADTPWLARDQARRELIRVMDSLQKAQRTPRLSHRGLLVNFLGFKGDQQESPLAGSVARRQFTDAFGDARGRAIWTALEKQGWTETRNEGRNADIKRGPHYGPTRFRGALEPYDNAADRAAILQILDERVVTIIFGDNANLSAAVGKAIGMLLLPGVRDQPGVPDLRTRMEQFLEAQQDGYAFLYDSRAGRFYFGWDDTRKEYVGWADEPAHNDYLINEFKGPTLFVTLRYGFPTEAWANMGFVLKSYPLRDGTTRTVPAAWDGSAFQVLGLGLMMEELHNPAWRALLDNAVTAELDYSQLHSLPGFLSEAYTGKGIQYTGEVGIPAMAVTCNPRIVTSPSLYSAGVAYLISPDRIEQWLGRQWATLSRMVLTPHGPWEGVNVATGKPIRFQTTAHTLALIQGLLRTSPDAMRRYLQSRSLLDRLEGWYHPGVAHDFMGPGSDGFAWAVKGRLDTRRQADGLQITGRAVEEVGLALVHRSPGGISLSNGRLTLRYRSQQEIPLAHLTFKPAGRTPPVLNQADIRLEATAADAAKSLTLILPATPGLSDVKEVVLTFGEHGQPIPVDFTLTAARFDPFPASLVK